MVDLSMAMLNNQRVYILLCQITQFLLLVQEICPHLAPLLRHGDWRVRKTATEQLGRMSGARARSAALGGWATYKVFIIYYVSIRWIKYPSYYIIVYRILMDIDGY